ncbi:MAG: metallophosphoesterase [Bryobacteraceae bacterium]|nr:metallophosphoesterase [Bryobacteraceae bacterium]
MTLLARRSLLLGGLSASAAISLAAEPESSFTFVHLTDTHIQPELHAADGCRMCFDAVNRVKPELVIVGGDLVFDAAASAPKRGTEVYDLYAATIKRLEAPVHTVIGNHDVFGVANSSGVKPSDPLYGKRMFEDRIGKRYYSFTHKGWQFIALDSIYLTKTGSFIGRIDDEQLTWLSQELTRIPKERPIVVITHVPLATSFLQYASSPATPDMLMVTNAREVLELLWPYKLKAVLQGHTHIRENVNYNGCQFITSGAVCGNWWKGLRLGHPEGFGVLKVSKGEIEWGYRTYGFRADIA